MTLSHLNEGETQEIQFLREAITTESGATTLFHEDNQMAFSYIYKNSQYSSYRRFGDNVNLATTSSQTGFQSVVANAFPFLHMSALHCKKNKCFQDFYILTPAQDAAHWQCPKSPSWSENQTFALLDFGSWMAPQEGCSVRSRITKQHFPSRKHIQASLDLLMINHAGFPAFGSMYFVSQVFSLLHCCWIRLLGCLWVIWTVLPPLILVPRACCPSQKEFSADLDSAQWGEMDLVLNKVLTSWGEGSFIGQSLLPCKGQVIQNCPLSIQQTEILKLPQKYVWGFFNITLVYLLHDSFTALILSITECIPTLCQEAKDEISFKQFQQDPRRVLGNTPNSQEIINPIFLQTIAALEHFSGISQSQSWAAGSIPYTQEHEMEVAHAPKARSELWWHSEPHGSKAPKQAEKKLGEIDTWQGRDWEDSPENRKHSCQEEDAYTLQGSAPDRMFSANCLLDLELQKVC